VANVTGMMAVTALADGRRGRSDEHEPRG